MVAGRGGKPLSSFRGIRYSGVDDIVSYVSRYITLYPGDLIFTGTPGSTRAVQARDVVEIEVEGVGVLRNTVSEWTP